MDLDFDLDFDMDLDLEVISGAPSSNCPEHDATGLSGFSMPCFFVFFFAVTGFFNTGSEAVLFLVLRVFLVLEVSITEKHLNDRKKRIRILKSETIQTK